MPHSLPPRRPHRDDRHPGGRGTRTGLRRRAPARSSAGVLVLVVLGLVAAGGLAWYHAGMPTTIPETVARGPTAPAVPSPPTPAPAPPSAPRAPEHSSRNEPSLTGDVVARQGAAPAKPPHDPEPPFPTPAFARGLPPPGTVMLAVSPPPESPEVPMPPSDATSSTPAPPASERAEPAASESGPVAASPPSSKTPASRSKTPASGAASAAKGRRLQPATLLASAVRGHPRLFADRATFDRIARSTTPMVQESLRILAAEAAYHRARPLLEYRVDGFRLLAVSRSAVQRISGLAGAYRMLGDRDAGDAACRNLMAIVRFQDWNPRHYLDVGEMTLAAALGYDWCYDLLTPEERQEVRAAIATKGIEPSFVEPQLFWVAGHTNWTQVCHAGLVAGALAIYEEEPDLARRTILRALTYLPKAADTIYDPSGNYPEGTMYWGYGTMYHLIAIEALRSVLGSDGGLGSHPGLLASGEFFSHGHGPTGQPFCYGDSSPATPGWLVNAASLAWFARENGRAALLPPSPMTPHRSSENAAHRFAAFLPLWLQDSPSQGAPLPLEWVGGGIRRVWMARSAWNDPEASFVGVTAGSPGDHHGHMDTGSFIFEQGGVRWAHDLGMHPYEPLEKAGLKLWDLSQDSQRWTVFRLGAEAHNILRLPGITQNVTGRATLVQRSEHPARPGCDLDLTSLYAPQATRVVRQVRFPGRSALEVTDEIEGLAITGTLRWQMMTQAQVEVAPDGRGAILTQDGRSLPLSVTEPARARVTVTPAGPTLPFERENPEFTRVVIEVPADQGSSTRIRVLLGSSPAPGRPGNSERRPR